MMDGPKYYEQDVAYRQNQISVSDSKVICKLNMQVKDCIRDCISNT